MKEDKLEEFIKSRRMDLDVEQADEDLVWEGIQNKRKKSLNYGRLALSWAAILIPLLALGTYLMLESSKSEKPLDTKLFSLADLGPEWEAIEESYENEIEQKWTQIEEDTSHAENLQFLFNELQSLDVLHKEYQNNLPAEMDDRFINTIIDFYEKKSRLLERILKELERTKQQRHENRSIEI
jgi:hypothetical protein